MFSPEEQQIEILLLKNNLEEIENDLVVQRSALPELDAENEEKYRDTMIALHVARTLNTEMERLKLESMRLTAKRLQLKNQCEDITKSLEQTRENRIELEKLLKEEERDIELHIRNYEDSLREKADRFRKTRNFYNEDEMKKELEMTNQMVIKLEIEEASQQNFVKELQKELTSLVADLPRDTLAIVGKKELDDKIKALSLKCTERREKRDHLLKQRRNMF